MNFINKFSRRIVLAVITLISLIPFYILLLLAFSPPSRSFSSGLHLMPQLYFNNFIEAWNKSKIGLAIFNSMVITVGSVVVIVILASSAGYAIARFKNKVNIAIFNTLLVCMMIPGIINTVPLYTLMKQAFII